MTCGPFANFCSAFLNQHGLRTRVVACKPMDRQYAGNDGHLLLEAFMEEGWVLFDVDQHAVYRHAGKRLNLLDAACQIRQDEYDVEPLAASVPLAVGSFDDNDCNYDYGLWMETFTYSEAAQRSWRNRIMHLPVLTDREGSACTAPEADRDRIKAVWPDLPWIPEDEFRQRFYGLKRCEKNE